MTPAEVPIQRRSLHARSAVTRRQAALCCRMMSSQPVCVCIRESVGETGMQIWERDQLLADPNS